MKGLHNLKMSWPTPEAEVLVLGSGNIQIEWKCIISSKFFFSTPGQRSAKLSVVMMTRKGLHNCKIHDLRPPLNALDITDTALNINQEIIQANIQAIITSDVGILVLRCGYSSHIVKVHYFFKIVLFCSPGIDQPIWGYNDDDHGRRIYQNCKFDNLLRGRGSCAEARPNKS